MSEGELTGRNFWGFKKTIPIAGISQLYRFRANGIEFIVADAEAYGKVYVSVHTEKVGEMIAFIEEIAGVELGG